MPFTPEERKQRMGFGWSARVAEKTKRTRGHISQVNKNPEIRPDREVIAAITEEIRQKFPKVKPSDIWPKGIGLSP